MTWPERCSWEARADDRQRDCGRRGFGGRGPMIELLGITVGQQSLVLGLVTGLTYAAFAAGFVLIYRSTGVLNFAHGEVGAFGVALFVLLLAQYGLNWWLSFVLALAACAAMGMAIELVVIRRLFTSPRLVVLIATIGVGQIVLFAKFKLPNVVAPGPISPPSRRSGRPPTTFACRPASSSCWP